MTYEYCGLDEQLLELNSEYDLLKRSKDASFVTRNEYVRKNEVNEKISQRLLTVKEHLAYVKEILAKDFFKNFTNANKRRILFIHKLKEFHNKNEVVKKQCKSLPTISQIEELSQLNEKLISELFRLQKLLKNTEIEYGKLFYDLERTFTKKVIELSIELIQVKRTEDYMHKDFF